VEAVAIATKVESAIGTLARCAFFWASSSLLMNSGMLVIVSCQRYLWSYNTFRCVMSSLSTFRCLTPEVHPKVSYILSSYFR